MKRYIVGLVAFVLLLVSLAGCKELPQEPTTVPETTAAQKRDFAVIDLGEIPASLVTYLPKTPFQSNVLRLLSMKLGDLVETVEVEDKAVEVRLKFVVTLFGRTFAPADVLANLQHFYGLHPEKVSANILQSEIEENTLRLFFDRPVDFEAEFLSLPMFPSGFLNGTDQDSLGSYYISAFAPGELLVLKSEQQTELHFVHMDVEVAKVAFEEGKLDLFLLPRDYAVEYWASKQSSGRVASVDADYVYMLGFGPKLGIEQRLRIIVTLNRERYVDKYLEGSAKIVNYPFEVKGVKIPETIVEDSVRLMCSVGSEWSYHLCESLKSDLEQAGLVVQANYTDFTTALNVGMSEESDYVYLFAWKRSDPERYVQLLGPEFEGLEHSEMEALYSKLLPVYSVAVPEVKYLVSKRHARLLELLGLENR